MSESGSPPKKIKRLGVQYNSKELTTPCSNCKALEKQLDEIRTTMQQQAEITQNQNKVVLEALAEQKVIMSKLLRQHMADQPLQRKFPLATGDQLEEMNKEITPETRDIYIKAIRTHIHSAGIRKGLENILSSEITADYNIDGIHGKKSLKRLEHFYSVLLDSIPTDSSGTPEEQLRKAIQLQKKRHFKRVATAKASDKTATP